VENDRRSLNYRILLIEIVTIIGIFTFLSFIILKMYIAADSLQRDAANTSKALIKAETIAEVLKSSDSFEAALIELGFTVSSIDSDHKEFAALQYYNYEWEQVQDVGKHIIKVKVSTRDTNIGSMQTATIKAYEEQVSGNEDELMKKWCDLIVKKFHNKHVY